MISEIVYTDTCIITLLQNEYLDGDDVNLDWRTGNSEAACEADDWNDYVAPFESEGFVQVKITSTL